ncbi:rhomboid family intramembrane serine protease [Salisaeta longa]|uniref:rhomboid family intramembrane serine protease n=1 Tax=Salisaeta longa TaxID=503170 RepID=UPI0003B37F59|nr:rhomboid family intramembrane serine protease [Salisaeta longa]
MNRRPYYQPPTQFAVFPPVIKNLLILNVLFFMAQFVAQQTLTESALLAHVLNQLPLYPVGSEGAFGVRLFGRGAVPGFGVWQLVSYSFLHGGFGHLLFNMFALWMFGVQIENKWGSQRFATFYFVCVVGAALVHLLFVEAPVPTIGASGGVFGVLLAFGMMFPNRPIYLYFLFPIKAKWLVIGLGALELFSGISGTQAGVANFAHLGGMLFGFGLIQYWRGKLPVAPDRVMRW